MTLAWVLTFAGTALACDQHQGTPSPSAPSATAPSRGASTIPAPSLTAVSPSVPIASAGATDSGRAECAQPDGEHFFFRAGALIPEVGNRSADHLMRHWLSLALRKMEEPSFRCTSGLTESYRLLVLPASALTFAVRVSVAKEGARVTTVVLDGYGLELGPISKRAERALLPAEKESFAQALEVAALWQMPTVDFSHSGFDGTEFVFEARRGDRYHLVHRWLPKPGAYADLCRLATRLGGM